MSFLNCFEFLEAGCIFMAHWIVVVSLILFNLVNFHFLLY